MMTKEMNKYNVDVKGHALEVESSTDEVTTNEICEMTVNLADKIEELVRNVQSFSKFDEEIIAHEDIPESINNKLMEFTNCIFMSSSLGNNSFIMEPECVRIVLWVTPFSCPLYGNGQLLAVNVEDCEDIMEVCL